MYQFEKNRTFIMLSLPIHECGMSLHILKSSLIYNTVYFRIQAPCVLAHRNELDLGGDRTALDGSRGGLRTLSKESVGVGGGRGQARTNCPQAGLEVRLEREV